MEELFLKFLNISITAGWLVLGILVVRYVLKKAPKWMNCLMWGIVGLRLVFPFSIESIFSLIPSKETIPQGIIYAKYPVIESGSAVVNGIVNPVLSTFFKASVGSINPIQLVIIVAANIWVLGLLVMLTYAVISSICLHRKMKEAVPVRENIWQSDYTESAFVFGVIRPRIFLSSSLKEEQMEYVIAHEKAHIARKDHWWKPIGFALLTVYWFQPLLWLAYNILCKDIESACDERVIKGLQAEEKKAYSAALLECTSLRKMIYACPVAFGELNVEQRVKNVLSYKKPGVWISLCAIVICMVLGIGFLTEPVYSDDSVEANDNETYVIEGPANRKSYLILMPAGQFIVVDSVDSDDFGGAYERGTYEQEGNCFILQLRDSDAKYELEVNGDELLFENAEVASAFITDVWNTVTQVESDRFVKLSTATLLERGWPEVFLEAMDDATKEMLVESGSWPASTYKTVYFDMHGNEASMTMNSGASYPVIESVIDDYALKLNIMVVPVGHYNFEEDNYESELDGVNVFCAYEFLQPPSTFGNEFKLRLSWTDGYFEMKPDGFLKIDKYNTKDGEFIHSYEPGYASGGPSEVMWYTKIKGAFGYEPDHLYGCGIIAMEKVKDLGEVNVKFCLEYQVNGKIYQISDVFSWDPVRVEVE